MQIAGSAQLRQPGRWLRGRPAPPGARVPERAAENTCSPAQCEIREPCLRRLGRCCAALSTAHSALGARAWLCSVTASRLSPGHTLHALRFPRHQVCCARLLPGLLLESASAAGKEAQGRRVYQSQSSWSRQRPLEASSHPLKKWSLISLLLLKVGIDPLGISSCAADQQGCVLFNLCLYLTMKTHS